MLWMLFQHMSECKEIFLALDPTIAGEVVVSLECPEPQEQLAAVSVGACRIFSNMVLLGHFAAQQGDYTLLSGDHTSNSSFKSAKNNRV